MICPVTWKKTTCVLLLWLLVVTDSYLLSASFWWWCNIFEEKERKGKKRHGGPAIVQLCSRSRSDRCVSWPPLLNNNNNRRKLYTAISPFGPLSAHTRTSIQKNSLVTKRKRHYYGGGGMQFPRSAKFEIQSERKRETKQQTKLCVFLFHDWDIKPKKKGNWPGIERW